MAFYGGGGGARAEIQRKAEVSDPLNVGSHQPYPGVATKNATERGQRPAARDWLCSSLLFGPVSSATKGNKHSAGRDCKQLSTRALILISRQSCLESCAEKDLEG